MELELASIKKILDEGIVLVFLPELADGYNFFESEIKETKAIGRYIEAEIANPAINRSIVISYLSSAGKRTEVLMVHIRNGYNGTFNVREYLQHTGVEFNHTIFNINEYKGSLSNRIESTLKANIVAMKSNISEVISGEYWEDVPFDWGDYK